MAALGLLPLLRYSIPRTHRIGFLLSNYKQPTIKLCLQRCESTSSAIDDSQQPAKINEEQGVAKVNYLKSSRPIPYKSDEEYPDWLWTLLDEPAEGSKTFIRRERKRRSRELNMIRKQRKF